MKKRWLLLGGIAFVVGSPFALVPILDREVTEARALENRTNAPATWDAAFKPAPVEGHIVPVPGLAAIGSAAMHGDGWQSDTHPVMGPVGNPVEIRSRQAGNKLTRQCATFLFRRDGKIIAMCGGLFSFRIVLLDPDTLTALASYDLPMRPTAFQTVIHRDPSITMSDSSGGAYMILDDQDRVVLGDSRYRIQIIEAVQQGGEWQLRAARSWDLRPYIPHDCQHYDNWFASGPCDMLTTVVPGPGGLYWWNSRYGRVGTLDPKTGKVALVALKGEEIQNAVAQDDRVVYVLSDHAQYAFGSGADGKPVQLWRYAYDRGSNRKVGSINQGSGTTPTLLGPDYLTITDNADGRINLLVLHRGALKPEQERLVCKMPLFAEGASAAENSAIGFNRSVVIENNSGYTSAREQKDYRNVRGGVTRIDVREDASGCDVVWSVPLKAPSVVAKLATKSGILWYATFEDAGKQANGKPDDQLWSLAGLDITTGKQVARIPLGTGNNWNNNWAPIALAPDNSLYVGTTRGIVQVRSKGRPAG